MNYISTGHLIFRVLCNVNTPLSTPELADATGTAISTTRKTTQARCGMGYLTRFTMGNRSYCQSNVRKGA
jgi:hypothetical protein